MRLTLYTDYSLRVLMYLALDPDQTSTIQEIAESYNVSKNHLMKVAYELGRAGYVETVRGRNGGLRLAKSASEINLGQLVRQCEGDFTLVECFDVTINQCVLTPSCKLRRVLNEALAAYFQVLDQYSLADLLQPKQSLVKLLAIEPLPLAAASTTSANRRGARTAR